MCGGLHSPGWKTFCIWEARWSFARTGGKETSTVTFLWTTAETVSLKASKWPQHSPWYGPPVSAPAFAYCGLESSCPICTSVQCVRPGVGLDSQTRIACPPFLGCSDNELIHSFFQSHEKRDLLYQGLDALPLSASKETGSDNQKNNSQLASSWQTGRAADTQGSTD